MTAEQTSQRDARGRFVGPSRGEATRYRWKPFTGPDGDNPGRLATLSHGAHSPAVVDPVAAELVEGIVAERPDLAEAQYAAAVAAWASAEARCLLLRAHYAKHGVFDADGEERPGLAFWDRCERQADRLRRQLGLDPMSDAILARARVEARHPVDVERLAEVGREALRSREGSDG